MADDNIDFRFLGRQVQNLQGDVRDLRAGHLRLEGDVVGLRADMSRMQAESQAKFESLDLRLDNIEAEMRAGFKAVDERFKAVDAEFATVRAEFAGIQAQFKQMAETAATNLQIVLAAINK